MNVEFEQGRRYSDMELGKIYFWTATINHWQQLLKEDRFKDVIINSLSHLTKTGKIDVFAFVIMPSHIHLIWRLNEMNGKEKPNASFLKFTAHEFKKMLQSGNELAAFSVVAENKDYEFWQRDSMAIELYTRKVAYQKLNYIHWNPTTEHWQLAADPCDYYYSSARFYDQGIKEFEFLKDLREEF